MTNFLLCTKLYKEEAKRMFVSRNFGFAWGLYMAAVVLWPGPAADDDIPVREALTAR